MSSSTIPSREPARLLDWYARRRRDLPWRRDGGPWATWVSEIMLQQTRVDTVIPYFCRFLERFPGVADLAAASEEEVLRYWAGLGYYRRARRLHRAAGLICERRGGEMPASAAEWRELPGVGEYTAAAIASITAGEPVPVVDGNVKRVAARVLALEDTPGSRGLQRAAADWCAGLLAGLPAGAAPGDLNQALMELGATVCLPREPRCAECPLAGDCAARASGTPAGFPRRAAKTRWVDLPLAFFLARDERGALLLQRSAGWNPGLYEPPSVADTEDAELPAAYRKGYRRQEVVGRQLAAVRHTITRHRIRARVFALEGWNGSGACDPTAVPLTGLARKILAVTA